MCPDRVDTTTLSAKHSTQRDTYAFCTHLTCTHFAIARKYIATRQITVSRTLAEESSDWVLMWYDRAFHYNAFDWSVPLLPSCPCSMSLFLRVRESFLNTHSPIFSFLHSNAPHFCQNNILQVLLSLLWVFQMIHCISRAIIFFWQHSESSDPPESSNLHPSRSSSDQIYPFHDGQAQKTTPIRFSVYGNIATTDTKVRFPVCQCTWLIRAILIYSRHTDCTWQSLDGCTWCIYAQFCPLTMFVATNYTSSSAPVTIALDTPTPPNVLTSGKHWIPFSALYYLRKWRRRSKEAKEIKDVRMYPFATYSSYFYIF